MATLNQIIRERKNVLRQLNAEMRRVDSKQEMVQRKIKSLTSRRNKVPEVEDLNNLIAGVQAIDTELNTLAKMMTDARTVFNL